MVKDVFGPQNLTLGKYRLIAELGHGGMSDVYLAVVRGAAGFEKLVVLKVLRPNLAEDPEFLSLFIKEANLAARLSHRNIVQTYEVGHEGDLHFIVMEYLEGQPFKRLLDKASFPKDRRICLRIVADALAGLHHAHELRAEDGTPKEVVHRDVSPHNIFVTYEGLSKVVDFGIAKALDASTETSAGVMKGKISYVAPEQAASKKVDRRADVFSAGVILYHIVTGKKMWYGLRAGQVSRRLLAGEIPKLRVEDGYDRNLVRIVNRALESHPQDRFPTADLLREELMAYLEQTGGAPDERAIARWMNDMFRDDRVLMAAIVKKQITKLRKMEQDQSLQSTGSISLARSAEASFPVEEEESVDSSTGHSRSSVTSSLDDSQSYPPAGGSDHERRRNANILWALSILLVALVVALVWFWDYTQERQATVHRSLVASDVVTAVASVEKRLTQRAVPRPVSSIDVVVSSVPRSAQLWLDGKKMKGNPFELKVPRDGKEHWVKAELEGYQTENRSVAFSRDIRLELVLRPLPRRYAPAIPIAHAAAVESSSASPQPSASSPAAVGPSEDSKPVRPTRQPLDTENPWSR